MSVDSKAALKLPVIKFPTGLQENTPQWETVKVQVAKALEELGCFEAVYEDIPPTLAKAAIDAVKQLSDLPSEVKSRYTSDEPHVGYFGNSPARPFLEAFGITDIVPGETLGNFATLMWPEGNPFFSETVHRFAVGLFELDKIVIKMVLQSWGLEAHFDEVIGTSKFILRIHNYTSTKRFPNCADAVALESHTDKNYVSILHQSEVNALNVLTKDGQWITFDPTYDNSFAVIIGDCFLALTNGRLHPCVHKAVASDRDRNMILLGTSPKWDGIVKVAPEMVDEEHPLQYKPFNFGEYTKFYVASYENRSLANALKEFCGA